MFDVHCTSALMLIWCHMYDADWLSCRQDEKHRANLKPKSPNPNEQLCDTKLPWIAILCSFV